MTLYILKLVFIVKTYSDVYIHHCPMTSISPAYIQNIFREQPLVNI